jgi:membrane protein YdbS with pleckstrin-like domain
MNRDTFESFENATLGLLVSIAAVHALRSVGAWETLPAWAVAAVFFCLSVARAWALRAIFRRAEG